MNSPCCGIATNIVGNPGIRNKSITSFATWIFSKLSLVTTATIQSCMGMDALLSIDPLSEPNVAIHPLAVVGHIGISINLMLLLCGPSAINLTGQE